MYKGKSNIEIVKNYLNSERPFVTVGYQKPAIVRKDGERWADNNGIIWEQKNGYTVRINEQANLIREASKQKCDCGQEIRYGTTLDNKFFIKTGKCYDCVIKQETDLHILGVYPFYEKWKLMSNYLSFLEDMKQKIKDSINYFEQESSDLKVLCNSEGFLESFKGMNTTELLQNARKDLKEITKTIKQVIKNTASAKKIYESELMKVRKTLTPK